MAVNVIPVHTTATFLQSQFSDKKFAEFNAANVLDLNLLAIDRKPGDQVQVPQMNAIPDFARVPVAAVSPLVFTQINTQNSRTVVLRDCTAPDYYSSDETRTGEQWRTKIAEQAGVAAARRFFQQLSRGLSAGLTAQAAADPARSHVVVGAGALTLQLLHQGIRRMGDQSESMCTMLIRSQVWHDLIRDIYTNWPALQNFAGDILLDAKLRNYLGLDNVIVCDDLLGMDLDDTTESGELFPTFLFTDKRPVYYGYQVSPKEEYWEDPRNADTIHYVKWSMDYAMGFCGLAFNGAVNPTDAAWGNAANWGVAYDATTSRGHLNVGAVMIESLGGVFA